MRPFYSELRPLGLLVKAYLNRFKVFLRTVLFMLSCCGCIAPLWSSETIQLQVHPLDFKQNPSGEWVHYDLINQLEWEDGALYIAGMSTAYITVLNEAGDILQQVGKKGQGPGEFWRGRVGDERLSRPDLGA